MIFDFTYLNCNSLDELVQGFFGLP